MKRAYDDTCQEICCIGTTRATSIECSLKAIQQVSQDECETKHCLNRGRDVDGWKPRRNYWYDDVCPALKAVSRVKQNWYFKIRSANSSERHFIPRNLYVNS